MIWGSFLLDLHLLCLIFLMEMIDDFEVFSANEALIFHGRDRSD